MNVKTVTSCLRVGKDAGEKVTSGEKLIVVGSDDGLAINGGTLKFAMTIPGCLTIRKSITEEEYKVLWKLFTEINPETDYMKVF